SGHSGRYRPQTDCVEKYSVVHVRDATRLALCDSGSLGSVLALARKILSPGCLAAGDLSAVAPATPDGAGQSAGVDLHGHRKALPFWAALSLYASMPLYNIHTFLALTVVLMFALVLERPSEIKFMVDLTRNEGLSGLGRLISHPKMWPEIFRGAPIRRHAAAMLAMALIPASFFVWLVTDHFRAASVLQWHPGWAQDSQEFAAPFFRMGGTANFGSSTMFGSLLQKTWNGVI